MAKNQAGIAEYTASLIVIGWFQTIIYVHGSIVFQITQFSFVLVDNIQLYPNYIQFYSKKPQFIIPENSIAKNCTIRLWSGSVEFR